MLPVRYPNFNFEAVFPRWAPHLEFAQVNNATSLTPCALEPFMIKVFQLAKARLDPVKDTELLRQVEWFIAQEAQHYRAHARFNKCFKNDRYPEIARIETKFNNELNGFLTQRSLEFCLAYSEGFEASGAIWYKTWFEALGKFREGAKPEAIALFDWHFAEEYEHREVAYKFYMAVAARGSIWRRIFYGYFYRIFGVFFAALHIGKFNAEAATYLLAADRAEMMPDERAASIIREKELRTCIKNRSIAGLLAIFSPFYNPAKKLPPAGLDALLAQFDAGGTYGPR